MNTTIHVFICYSHKDGYWQARLFEQLNPFQLNGRLKIWNDNSIRPGARWKDEINQQLSTCDVALLLVSSSFLNSHFINQVEFKQLEQRSNKSQCRLIPVIAKPCAWRDVLPLLGTLEVRPKGGHALSQLPRHEADRVLTELARDIIKPGEEEIGAPRGPFEGGLYDTARAGSPTKASSPSRISVPAATTSKCSGSGNRWWGLSLLLVAIGLCALGGFWLLHRKPVNELKEPMTTEEFHGTSNNSSKVAAQTVSIQDGSSLNGQAPIERQFEAGKPLAEASSKSAPRQRDTSSTLPNSVAIEPSRCAPTDFGCAVDQAATSRQENVTVPDVASRADVQAQLSRRAPHENKTREGVSTP